MRARAHAFASALALAFALAGEARADTPPSQWDRVKHPRTERDPGVGATYRLHVEVQRMLTTDDDRFPTGFTEALDSRVLRAKTMLERANAEESPDVRLRFDLGHVYHRLGHEQGAEFYGKAVRVLKKALAIAPDDPAAERAWLDLAFACGYAGDHECEEKAYTKILRIETEERHRATPSLNLAETEMHLGRLKEAVELYRESFRLAGTFPSGETPVLAVWGLAVALDRSGDVVTAEKEVRFALEIEHGMNRRAPILRTEGVFFVPAYEIHWYEGLGHAARAKIAPNPTEALRLWRAAEASYGAYVRLAQPDDRWLDLAKVRLANAKTQREAVEKIEKRRPKPATKPDADDTETTF